MKDEEEPQALENLEELDLSFLNLDELELDPSPPPSIRRWGILLIGIGVLGFLIWFPTSDLYRASAHDNTYFFALSGASILMGLLGGRWLWGWMEEIAARVEAAPPRPPREDRVVTATERWATLGGAIAGLITAGLASADHLGIPGQNTSPRWWLIALGALMSAGLGGRWIFIQAHRPHAEVQDHIPIELPKWFKWVTFSLLILAGLFAMLGSRFFGQIGSVFNTSVFGSVGLITGTLGAIWISKRFDEMEQRFKESVNGDPPGETTVPPNPQKD